MDANTFNCILNGTEAFATLKMVKRVLSRKRFCADELRIMLGVELEEPDTALEAPKDARAN